MLWPIDGNNEDKKRKIKGIEKSHYSAMLSKLELRRIREKIPNGGYSKIGEMTGYDPSTVGKCLRDPKHFNEVIIDASLLLIEEQKRKISDLKQRVKNTTK